MIQIMIWKIMVLTKKEEIISIAVMNFMNIRDKIWKKESLIQII